MVKSLRRGASDTTLTFSRRYRKPAKLRFAGNTLGIRKWCGYMHCRHGSTGRPAGLELVYLAVVELPYPGGPFRHAVRTDDAAVSDLAVDEVIATFG